MNKREESNNLIKVKLTANILFSGIGCQERGFEDSGLFDIEVVNTSDINKESVLSYAAIHCGLTNEMIENYENYPPREEMARYLTDINLGYEPEKNKKFNWFKLIKKKTKDLEKYWLACKLTNNRGDISNIEELPYADFWTCSFPCTDISVSGKMKGLNPDSGTRSSLLWENIKLLKKAKENKTLPKYIMVENVKNLVSKKFIEQFNDLLNIFDELGFNTYWKVINGKDCGVPQNRERVFVIAIRKDIDTEKYQFPLPFDTGIRLKDVLENSVDEKYYISEDKIQRFLTNLNSKGSLLYDSCQIKRERKAREYNDFCPTLTARDYKDPKIINDNAIKQVGNISDCNGNWNNPQVGRIYSTDGLCPTLNTCGGGGLEPKIVCGIDKSYNTTKIIENVNCITTREDRGISNRKSEGTAVLENRIYKIGSLSSSQDAVIINPNGISKTYTAGHNNQPKIMQIGNINPSGNGMNGNVFSEDGLSPTLTTNKGEGNKIMVGVRIRKLTPLECFRLMGFRDNDYYAAKNIGISDSQAYKQTGNGIITDCCKLIAEHLYKAQYDNTYKCFDENFTRPQVD